MNHVEKKWKAIKSGPAWRICTDEQDGHDQCVVNSVFIQVIAESIVTDHNNALPKDLAFCYWINPSQDDDVTGGFVPALVRENESGYSMMTGQGAFASPWVWGKTFEQAEEVCARKNKSMGLSADDVSAIIGSSMAAKV